VGLLAYLHVGQTLREHGCSARDHRTDRTLLSLDKLQPVPLLAERRKQGLRCTTQTEHFAEDQAPGPALLPWQHRAAPLPHAASRPRGSPLALPPLRQPPTPRCPQLGDHRNPDASGSAGSRLTKPPGSGGMHLAPPPAAPASGAGRS